MVLLRRVDFISMCEHHFLPFEGTASVAYIPLNKNSRVVGISKLARVVDAFACRLQIQERLTVQIANCVEKALHPAGVGVVIKAAHSCLRCRGVKKANTEMITSCLRGVFKNDAATRAEFFNLIKD